jgi:hypothetical protein
MVAAAAITATTASSSLSLSLNNKIFKFDEINKSIS